MNEMNHNSNDLDIRIVNLYRKAIHAPKVPQAHNESLWLATDYFDAFEVQKIDLQRLRFGLIEAINAKMPTMNDVATQSFPLVCTEEDVPQGAQCDAWGEPFDEDKSKYPFLSIIQTYITPEAFARNDTSEGNHNHSYSFTGSYFEDIYSIVRDFWTNNSNCQFKFKIYRSLSVGDFAVVICSKKADVSYCISTAMRRRRSVKHDPARGLETAKEIVIYKTYTILSMYNSWIQNDLETGAENGKFILRCCYSNKYWLARSCKDEELKKHEDKISQKLNRLTGRYDFSVSLTDHRFGHLFEDLQHYKLGQGTLNKESQNFHTDTESDDYDEADYLHYLIINQYLSHVNERFSFIFSENGLLVPCKSNIYLQDQKAVLEYTDISNQKLLKYVKTKCERTIDDVRKIPGYHKNLDNNMRLLSRLVDMCGTLNGLSDMRIYCTLVLKYLDVLLDNLKHYCVGINKFDKYELISYVDNALGSMIFVLNTYIDYVRNNNLQSLQTPNYNIESNLSLEKYLIGYSNFIGELLNWYKEAFDFLDIEWKEDGGTRRLEPVVVPQAENEVLTVQVFFPRFDFSDKEDVNRLMVVKCPTFSELTNIAEMTATLIHETAHRFRYEKRGERNRVIALYIARRAFDGASKGIVEEIQREFKFLPLLERCYLFLNNEMAEAYLQVFYPELYGSDPIIKDSDIRKYPMRLLGQRMEDDYRTFIEADNCFDEFDIKLRRFLDTAGEIIDFSNSDVQKAFRTLIYFKEKYLEFGKKSESCDETKECIEKKIYLLFDNTENAIKTLCPEFDIKDAVEETKWGTENAAERAYGVLLDCLVDLRKNRDHYYNASVINRREEFYKKLYHSICSNICLPKEHDNSSKIELEIEVARYLCVDFESDGNYKVFKDIVERIVRSMLEPSIELAKRSVFAYRELTADLFMVKFLELDYFGYLLVSASNMPMGNEPLELNLRRVANVLYVRYKGEKKDEDKIADENIKEDLDTEWERIVMELWNKTLNVIMQMLEKNVNELRFFDELPNFSEIQESFIRAFNALKMAKEGETPLDIIKKVLKAMEDLRDDIEKGYISDKTEGLRYMLLEITTLHNVLQYIHSLSIHGLRHIKELKAYGFLEDDLVKGYSEIKKMREKLSDKSLEKHFQAVKAYYNDPYGSFSDSVNSIEMLSFILRMFYKKKVQTAGEIIDYVDKQ